MTRRLALAAALAAVFAGAVPAPAGAVEATAAEVSELARAAADDPAALRRLRAIDRIDGRPAQLGRALETRDRRELEARLAALADGADQDARGGTASARRDAAAILDQRRYKRSKVPAPLRGPFERLGDWLRDAYDWLADRAPGGDFGAVAILAALVLLVAGLLAGRLIRTRVEEETHAATAQRQAGEDPAALRREADAADRDGDHARAIRLRFRAGLLDLDARGAIELRPGLTTGAIARQLDSPDFDDLAATFERVAYGDEPATAEESAAAKAGWERLRPPRRRARTRELEAA